jgi:hypothetical protein
MFVSGTCRPPVTELTDAMSGALHKTSLCGADIPTTFTTDIPRSTCSTDIPVGDLCAATASTDRSCDSLDDPLATAPAWSSGEAESPRAHRVSGRYTTLENPPSPAGAAPISLIGHPTHVLLTADQFAFCQSVLHANDSADPEYYDCSRLMVAHLARGA